MTDLFPTQPKPSDPREKRCATCGSYRAHCGDAGRWFCPEHAPSTYWPPKAPEPSEHEPVQ